MKAIRLFFSHQTLRTRLITWFFVIFLLSLGGVMLISYQFAKKILLNQTVHNLQNLSLLQAQMIENYFIDKKTNLRSLAKEIAPSTAKELETILIKFGKNSPEYEMINREFLSRLALKTETLDYYNILLINAEGTIVFSILSPHSVGINVVNDQGPYASLRDLFEITKNFLETQISNFIYDESKQMPAYFIASPILNQEFIGVIIAQLDYSRIFKLLTNYNVLGDTGETILVTELDDHLVSIVPSRYEQQGNSIQIIPVSTPFGRFILEILEGKHIVDNLVDYRSQKVLMVGHYLLPNLKWGIITKMDMTELLAPINKLKFLFLMMAIMTAAIVAFTAFNIAQALTYPILLLTKKIRRMADGDLSQRMPTDSDDEFGDLGRAFNNMAIKFNEMVTNLDSIVFRRTEEVKQQNIRLKYTIEELQQAQNRLINQEKLASLGALTAGIAHEIKNPLNFINNFADLSLQINEEMQEQLSKLKSRFSEEEMKFLQDALNTLRLNMTKIYEHGKRANGIVHNMLQHSRGAPGEKVPTDLNALLDEYVALAYHGMRAQDSSFNVKIEKNYDKTLPKIPVVPQEMSRVFLNLINNAYYSVNQKKKKLKEAYTPIIRITTQNYRDLVVIKIWDNGEGIPDKIFPKLFTPFFTTKPPGEGTGLGLSLSYNIVIQGHNGTLTADSEFGEFAEFTINLPLRSKQH